MLRLGMVFVLLPALTSASLINTTYVDASLFNITTVATGLGFPAGMLPLPDGSLLVENSPNYGLVPAQLLSYASPGSTPTTVYTSSVLGLMTGFAQVGNYYAVGNDSSEIGPGGDHSIRLLLPGATSSDPMTLAATLQLNYPQPWEHANVGLAARPTPGVPGSYDLIINVGAQGDNTATPAGSQVTLTGTGFSSIPTTNLSGDSLYLIRIDETGAQPAVTQVQQIVTGIRNVFGMAFDPLGDLYFTDNAIDMLPAGSPLPVEPDDEPPQADELNFLAAAQIGNGAPPNYGFPSCYIQYAYSGTPGVPVGSGCVQPLLAFQPITDGSGQHELEGPTQIAFAPSSFPAGFNNGIFVGFTGGESPNDEAGMAYYNLATQAYIHFIESLNPDSTSIIGVASSGNAMYFTDGGSVYELTSASPEPGTIVLVLSGMIVAIWLKRRRAEARLVAHKA